MLQKICDTTGQDAIAAPKIAVCFLAFDRHHLVRLTISRLVRLLPPGWALRVWQDGHQEQHSGNIVGNAGRIQRNLAYFKTLGLDVAHQTGVNRCTAITYWEAEHWAFETIGADAAIFIEDDIVISKHYFTMMEALARLAIKEPRVGAFSAFGDAGIHWLAQWVGRRRLQPMHHRWGYGITRDYWRRTRRDYQDYLALLEGKDYRARPHAAISDWIGRLGKAEAIRHITGQDGARTAIMLKLGCFSIMTTPSYAINIGKRGMHFWPQFYQENLDDMKGRHGFFPWPVSLPMAISPVAMERLDHSSRCLAYW
jgi:hypothetical protein